MAFAPKFKQKCRICKKEWVIVTGRQFPVCTSCHMKMIDQPIKNPKFKKLFDIPRKFYKENHFLRSIKESYLRFEALTKKQIDAFKRVVKEMKEKKDDVQI